MPNERIDGKGTFDSPEISYNGYWRCGKYQGQGTLTNKREGSRQTGRFENNNCIDGELVKGKEVYVGTFNSSGERNGRGTIKNPRFKYTGLFYNGQPHGKGKLVWVNGAVLEGTFENGEFVEGVLRSAGFTCNCEFVIDHSHEQGKSSMIDGIITKGTVQDCKLVDAKIDFSDLLRCKKLSRVRSFDNGNFRVFWNRCYRKKYFSIQLQ